MNQRVDHIAGVTYHGRKGAVENAFRYGVDFVLCDAEADLRGPAIFGRNRRAPVALRDSDHGGPPGAGRGPAWVRDVMADRGLDPPDRIDLIAQPRMLGHVFNPVSFWIARDRNDGIRAVIAEVTNTFGERHSYLCRHPDGREITGHEILTSEKIFYVSPFQPVEGGYTFRFDIRPSRVNIRIDYSVGNGGLVATLSGQRRVATTTGLLWAMLRRPFGSRRVLALIHWQALKLWWKGAPYKVRPSPPAKDLS